MIRIAFERIKGIAHGDVRRPRDAAIRAERIEQLGIRVICSIARVQPHRIDPSIGGYRQGAKPVPLVVIDWIVINPVRSAKGQSTVCAAHEHHVRPGVEAGWLHTGQHVNIVISGAAGTVYCQEQLPFQAAWIDRVAEIQTAAKVDLGDSIKSGRDSRVLRIAGAKAPKWAGKVGRATDKEIAVRIHIECSPHDRVRNAKRTLPGGAAVCGPAELAAIAGGGCAPSLVLEPMTHAVGFIDGKPLLVTSSSESVGLQAQPGLAAVR